MLMYEPVGVRARPQASRQAMRPLCWGDQEIGQGNSKQSLIQRDQTRQLPQTADRSV